MDRTLSASTWRLPRLSWRHVLIAALVAVDLLATLHLWVTWVRFGAPINDWDIFSRVTLAAPYADPGFRWTPLAGWILATLIVAMGITLWRLLHVAALAFLGDWRIALVVAVSFPFIYDVADANLLTFAFVAAWCGLRGSKIGTFAFLAMTVLVPRPLMIPVAVWLLWKRPEWRLPFVGMTGVVLGHAVLTGELAPFLERLAQTSAPEMGAFYNIGPSRLIGVAWVPIGLTLGAWLTWKGRLGLASLAISPYLIGYYLLFGFLELYEPMHQGGVRRIALRRREGAAVPPLVGSERRA